MTRRRNFLKATGIALGTTALPIGNAGAQSEWRYELAGEALDAGVHEVVVQGDWAYTANGASIATVDMSDPETPVLGGTAPGNGENNVEVQVDGDVAVLANDGVGTAADPFGVTVYDVSDPRTPRETAFYETASGIHNCYVEDGYAYLCVNESGEASFSRAFVEILDISDPASPERVGTWGLYEYHPDMAMAGINPVHDLYVQNDFAYMAWWDAGVVVADVSDKTDPTAVAHFGAADHADDTSMGNVEGERNYLGGHKNNAHYVQPTPDGNWTFVGAETFPGPFEDTVVPGDHGGIRVFDTSGVTRDSTPSNPTESHEAYIPAPEPLDDAVQTSHNFDVTDSKLYASFYQGGLRAYDIEDPMNPTELAAFAPEGTAYWAAVDFPVSGPRHYTVGSDIGKGLTVLELVHETPGKQAWKDNEDLEPRDLLGPTMKDPL
jgi:hypothetical protein